MQLITFTGRLLRWAICAPICCVRPFDLVIDGLADVVQQPAHLGRQHVGADLAGDDAGETRGLDRVLEHVLAVAACGT